jgi:phospholipase/lecithinase/hemolysin
MTPDQFNDSGHLAFWAQLSGGLEGIFVATLPGSLPGDFNQDRTVDAADYIVWRDGLRTAYTQNDFEVWRAHYGQTAGSGSIANVAIPEPATAMLAIVAMLQTLFWTTRRWATGGGMQSGIDVNTYIVEQVQPSMLTSQIIVVLMALYLGGISIQHLHAGPYSGIVVFGDSLSDTGNYATRYIDQVLPPPYDGGRWSNGPVWVEVLAERLGLPLPVDSSHGGTNYAWGGGTTGSVAGSVNMDVQLQRFLQSRQPSEDELFIVWGGANDFFLGQTNPLAPVGKLTNIISQLTQAGAKNFLVVNLPERIGIYPDLNNRLSQLAPTFNSELWAALDELQSSTQGLNIVKFDFHELYDMIAANPSRFGFSNLEQPACSDCALWDLSQRPTGYVFGNVVLNPDQYYLWDDVHPSAAAHRVIGDAAYALLDPLPGDFNQDGTVDAADYVVWRDGLGTTYTQDDYELWRANFGKTPALSGSVSSDSVPEAGTLVSLSGILFLVAWHPRPRRVLEET